MAKIRPFAAIRPDQKFAAEVAALPYDVYNRAEAKEEVHDKPLSFLRIDRAETQLPDSVSTYAPEVYAKAKELFSTDIKEGIYVKEAEPCFYIYELTMDGRKQAGIVACASIDDYESGVIKKHENTRAEKEKDRIMHVDTLSAQTGPIFLAYRTRPEINSLVTRIKLSAPLYDFKSDDDIGHTVWRVDQPADIKLIEQSFAECGQIYIADGHHRCASAVKVGLKRRAENPGYTGEEEFNYFLSVLFPHDQLKILPYNRVVANLNGLSDAEFLDLLSQKFRIEGMSSAFEPDQKGTFGLYLTETWYKLTAYPNILSDDPVKGLDVSILQDQVLDPILGIKDPRTDNRIDFVGGIRGLKELERRAKTDMQIAFSLYPTSIDELFDVADAGLLMPPKSTWFEPKLRSGLFIHKF